MQLKKSLTCLLLCLLTPLYGAMELLVTPAGQFTFSKDGKELGTLTSGYFLPEWQARGFAASLKTKFQGNSVDILGGLPTDSARINMKLSFETIDNNKLRLNYTFTPTADVMANSVHASVNFDASIVAGHSFHADGSKAGDVPVSLGESIHLFAKGAQTFKLDTAAGPFVIELAKRQGVLLQDNRRWGTSVGLRLSTHSETPLPYRANTPYHTSYTITFPEPFTLIKDEPFTLEANDEWIPLKVTSLEIEKDSALDFSDVVKLDAPAGKHGWTVARGPNFEFENMPNVPQRFYGVNFCFSAHNISPEQSEILATRLARLGYNAVRYHHFERNICVLNIPGDSTQLDPVKMAQFDAMFAAMKNKGLYATTDLYVSRNIYASEVFPDGDPKEVISGKIFKNLCAYDSMAMDNWKKFARRLLTHVNPHTGISYAKDPALSLISLINEGTLDTFGVLGKDVDPRLRKMQLKAWNRWLTQKYGSAEARNRAWQKDFPETLDNFHNSVSDAAARDFNQFLADTENAMIAEMKRFLREELDCRALITDMNCGGKSVWAQLARSNLDYVDDHFYIDHPSFIEKPWRLPSRCNNTSVVKNGRPGGSGCAFARIIDKPYTITEWNYSGPGRYRGVGGILTGCMASIQNWSGLWRFAYSHSSNMFKAGNAGYFDLVHDPLNQAADRASILLYLRGDLSSAKRTIVATISKDHNLDPRNKRNLGTVPSWTNLVTLAQVGTFVGSKDDHVPYADISVSYSHDAPTAKIALNDPDQARSKATGDQLLQLIREQQWLPADNETLPAKNIAQTADKQFTMNGSQDMMILNTPKTAGGFAPASMTVDTDAIKVTMLDTDATVWVSSLSDAPIVSAKRLLLTHLTDLQNTGELYMERARKTVLRWGRQPYLVRNGRAEVILKLKQPEKATVWAIDVNGKRLDKQPAVVTPEGLKLMLSISGRDNAQMLYEITVD